MSMNWGVRGALLTSDHFGASGEVKLRFSAAPGLDPWHGVPGVISAPRGPRAAIDLASIAAGDRDVFTRRGVRLRAGCSCNAAKGRLLHLAVHLGSIRE